MASRAHQFIVDLLAQRISSEDYEIVSFDGLSETENGLRILPPTIKRHRPDLIGLKKGHLIIGEAKTAGDIGVRTHEQIEDYIGCSNEVKETQVKIYLGVPLSVENKVKDIVKAIPGSDCVTTLAVPDRLLPQDYD